MERFLLVLLLLLAFSATRGEAAFYQWTDSKGVVHLTDQRKKIPAKYRAKAKPLKLPPTPAPADSSAPAPRVTLPQPARPLPPMPQPAAPLQKPAAEQAAPQAEGAQPAEALERNELWWRRRFVSLRGEVKELQDGLTQKQARLLELRRERTLFMKASDREAVNAMEAEIAADESKINDLKMQLEALDQEASREAVPFEWRQ